MRFDVTEGRRIIGYKKKAMCEYCRTLNEEYEWAEALDAVQK